MAYIKKHRHTRFWIIHFNALPGRTWQGAFRTPPTGFSVFGVISGVANEIVRRQIEHKDDGQEDAAASTPYLVWIFIANNKLVGNGG